MNLGGSTNTRGLASVTGRAGKGDLVNSALDATPQGNRTISDGGESKVMLWGDSVHGRLKSEEASGEGKVKNGISEANKGGPIPSTGCLLLKEAHEVWRCVYLRQGKGRWSGMKERNSVNVALYLYSTGWGIVCTALAGDASTRRETRLTCEYGSDRSKPRPGNMTYAKKRYHRGEPNNPV